MFQAIVHLGLILFQPYDQELYFRNTCIYNLDDETLNNKSKQNMNCFISVQIFEPLFC